MYKKKNIDDAILMSKIYLKNFDIETKYKKKLIKRNKTIGNLKKTIEKLKKEINEMLNYIKYPTYTII